MGVRWQREDKQRDEELGGRNVKQIQTGMDGGMEGR